MKIYHNPRCTKSRDTLKIIQENGVDPDVVEYLKDTPSKEELKELISMLGISPEGLIRKGETIFKENYKGKTLSDDEWIDAMVENPKLIERPIVVNNGQAIIGRPPENVKKIL
ncbi:arsenate reductase (glutaredoxin) [Marinigracilibium pacificum]|nr:arsenate reductase (glutaredoxin) [Marinigracilibium pacificum]